MDDHVLVSIKSRPDVPLSLAWSGSTRFSFVSSASAEKNADLRVLLRRRRRRLFVLKYLGLALVSRNFGNYTFSTVSARPPSPLLPLAENWLLPNEITLVESLFIIRVAAATQININHIPSLHAAGEIIPSQPRVIKVKQRARRCKIYELLQSVLSRFSRSFWLAQTAVAYKTRTFPSWNVILPEYITRHARNMIYNSIYSKIKSSDETRRHCSPMPTPFQEESLIIKPATKMQTPSAIYMHTRYTLWQYIKLAAGRRISSSDLQQQQKPAAFPLSAGPLSCRALMQRCMRALHY